MKKLKYSPLFSALLAIWSVHGVAHAQRVIEDNLTGASSKFDWKSLNGACLTAGDNTGSIPACVGLSYYGNRTHVGGTSGRLPDKVGEGALRLTNGSTASNDSNGDNQTGAVVSNFTFPTNEGLKVTFQTVTYGGDDLKGTGADGIAFYLMDGDEQPSVGALGGSLGYSCSNINSVYDGVVKGYLAIGVDEYGNFANPGDNTDTGPGSIGMGSEPNFKAGRISMRGAGDTNWASLHRRYPASYPSGLTTAKKAEAVKNTCKTGTRWDYSNGNGVNTGDNIGLNYPLISMKTLPSTVSISNQQSMDRPLRDNAVPITYTLNLTQDGLLDFSYSVDGGALQTVIASRRITDSNGPLPSSFRFGFSSGTGGGNNVHEILCFKAAPVNQANSSAGTNQESSRAQDGLQVYLAYYNALNWWGRLTAQQLLLSPDGTELSVSSVATWDASCTLTGGECTTMAAPKTPAPTIPEIGWDKRSMLTWNGTSGVPLRWDSLTAAQQSALTAGETANDARLRFLRGDRSTEVANSGAFRTRTGLLGDIINSSPTLVGAPQYEYTGNWADRINLSAKPTEPAGSYASFMATQELRQNIVYIGANDGLIHGFRAGARNSSGNFQTSASTPNDGVEVLAYMPASVLSMIHSTDKDLDYSNPSYVHNLYVDATPGTGDLYYDGKWHTWLVGGLGAGGRATGPLANQSGDSSATATGTLFALDVTDPSSFREANASSLVVGEWTSQSLTCARTLNCGRNLGSTFGTPDVRRLHNGSWAVLFGNGQNSENGKAGIFVMVVDPAKGDKTFYFLEAGSAPAAGGAKNGISYITPADLDGDHIVDYVYAGDAMGNLWRFDLTSSDPNTWAASRGPLFKTENGQPITTKPTVASKILQGAGDQRRIMVSFGTGRQYPQTITSAASYAGNGQSLYGIWDWDMAGWNAKGSVKYVSLAADASVISLPSPFTVTAARLQAQTITSTTTASTDSLGKTIPGYRTVSSNNICWQGSAACKTNGMYGWKLGLPAASEQVIYSPAIINGWFVVNTFIPGGVSTGNAAACDDNKVSGFTMAVSVDSGAAPSTTASDPFFPDSGLASVAGIGLGATGTPGAVEIDKSGKSKKWWLVQQTSSGKPTTTKIKPEVGTEGRRVNWINLR